jgi:hypothetical protein
MARADVFFGRPSSWYVRRRRRANLIGGARTARRPKLRGASSRLNLLTQTVHCC